MVSTPCGLAVQNSREVTMAPGGRAILKGVGEIHSGEEESILGVA
jgi:hypothetical protein